MMKRLKNLVLVLCILFYSCTNVYDEQNDLYFTLRTDIIPESGGSLSLTPGPYKFNTIRTLYAKPNEGWKFDHWEGIVSGLNNPTEIIFYGDHDIRAVFVQDTFKVRTLAGGKGRGFENTQFNYPTGIAYDKEDNLYVSDMHNHRIQKWIKGATFGVTVAGGNGYGNNENQLNEPGKIAIDALNHLYIADTENNRIQKWYQGAAKGETIAGGNGVGNQLNQLHKPYGIVLDKDGAMYVSEIENHRVMRWDPNATSGVIVAGGKGEGNDANQLAFPLGIALDRNGNLYVADTYNHRIQLWKPGAIEGVTLFHANQINSDGVSYFTGITIDENDQLYITDYYHRSILKFDLTTKEIMIVAGGNSDGNAQNQLSQPYEIITKKGKSLIVADAKNDRIQRWKIDK